jgi:hypothetical protein
MFSQKKFRSLHDRLDVSCTVQPSIENPCHRENFPGVSRPSKTLTYVLIGSGKVIFRGEFPVCPLIFSTIW